MKIGDGGWGVIRFKGGMWGVSGRDGDGGRGQALQKYEEGERKSRAKQGGDRVPEGEGRLAGWLAGCVGEMNV